MPDRRKTSTSDRIEAADLIADAIKHPHWGFSDVEIDAIDSTVLHATLRSRNTSRTFTATIHVTDAKEL